MAAERLKTWGKKEEGGGGGGGIYIYIYNSKLWSLQKGKNKQSFSELLQNTAKTINDEKINCPVS